MLIRFTCGACSKRLKMDDRHAGRKIKCPRCSESVTVPTLPAEGPTRFLSETEIATPKSQSAGPEPSRPSHANTTMVDDDEPPVGFSKRRGEDEELDMTPMVDVVFLLLIFFMVTAAFALQKSIRIPSPDNPEAVAQTRTIEEIEQDDDYVIVRIDADNTIWVEDGIAHNEQRLLTMLRKITQDARQAGSTPPNSLLVMASGDCRLETVVLALDAGTAIGMENVRLSTNEEDAY